MTKIVYNACYVGFSLSHEAISRYAKIKGITEEAEEELYLSDRDIERTDPVLVQVVEELGELADGACARLQIKELVSGTLYRIDEYDGYELVMTIDDYNWSVA
jgi:hypothetical protein